MKHIYIYIITILNNKKSKLFPNYMIGRIREEKKVVRKLLKLIFSNIL